MPADAITTALDAIQQSHAIMEKFEVLARMEPFSVSASAYEIVMSKHRLAIRELQGEITARIIGETNVVR